MLEKLVRAIVTIIGAIVGYGFYLLIKYLAGLKGYNLETIFSVAEKMFIVTAIALIFAIIFYKLFFSLIYDLKPSPIKPSDQY